MYLLIILLVSQGVPIGHKVSLRERGIWGISVIVLYSYMLYNLVGEGSLICSGLPGSDDFKIKRFVIDRD